MTDLSNSGAGASHAMARREPPVVSVVSTSTSTALRVDYDGRHPPLELFFVWTSLGWRAPVPASPPREAIDWSTPDHARGTRHTILPFEATGTATLDSTSRVDADAMVREALDAADRLGAVVERPADTIAEIDLRDAAPASQPLPTTDGTGAAAPPSSSRVVRSRRPRGAVARVRAIVSESSIDAVSQAARDIGADMSHDDEPLLDPDDERRARVTFEVPASAADSAMRVLASLSHGTPTIEIVSARALADGRG